MSLPSWAIFLDKDGKPLAYGFCNIGWYFDEEELPRCVDTALKYALAGEPTNDSYVVRHYKGQDFDWDHDWISKWTHVTLYDHTLDREFLTADYERRVEERGHTIDYESE